MGYSENSDMTKWMNLGRALDQSTIMIKIDTSGTVLEVNQNFLNASGFNQNEVVGRFLGDFINGHFSAEIFRSQFEKKSHDVYAKVEFHIIGKQDRSFWVDCSFLQLETEDGERTDIQIIGTDISERKRFEDSLKSDHLIQKSIVEVAQSNVLFFDEEGGCTYINPKMAAMTGRQLAHLVGSGWLECVHPEDREKVRQHWVSFVEFFVPFKMEFRYLDLLGNEKWVYSEASAMPCLQSKTYQFVRIEKDQTELRMTQKILVEQEEKMLAFSKFSELGEMASGIAHEINNPLAVIRARAVLLNVKLANGTFDPSWGVQVAQSIDQTSNRIAKIIKSLKTISRDGSRDPFQSVCLKSIVEDTLELTHSRFAQGSVQLIVDPVDPELSLSCRPVQICQILLNLLNNAYDASVTQENAWVRLSINDVGPEIEISVTDSGPGISEESKGKLFQPYFTTKPPGVGTGLGLSVSQKIVNEHQGKMFLDCSSPQTRFVARLNKNPQHSTEKLAA